MTDGERVTLFLKKDCPHCLKVRLFLLEAGLTDTVAERSFTSGDVDEAAIRAEIAMHVAKTTFRAIRDVDGTYLTESDVIIDRIAGRHGVDPKALPVFASYACAVLPRYVAARRALAAAERG